MILTNKQSLTMILTHAKDNIRWGKVQSIHAEDLVVEGLQMLLNSHAYPNLETRNCAAKKFLAAYKQGSALGTFLAGIAYKYGFGIKNPRPQLGDALVIVATQGYEDPVALYFVGVNLLHNNNPQGIDYLEVASAAGIKESSLTLALIHLFRKDLVPTSYVKAIGYLQISGDIGQGLLDKVQAHVHELMQRQELHSEVMSRPKPQIPMFVH